MRGDYIERKEIERSIKKEIKRNKEKGMKEKE